MASKKAPTKKETSKAAKVLSTSSSKAAKSEAAKTLAKKSVLARKVKDAPRSGSVSKKTVQKAIRSTSRKK